MRQKILICFFLVCLFILAPFSAFAQVNVNAPSAILIDAQTGKLLYSKNPYEQRPPASTTKILTAIIAIEKGNLEKIVNISDRAAQTGEARLNLVSGEKITLKNLIYGALLKSGNDSTVAIAEGVAASVEEFVEMMNLKAKLIGCTNSHFSNTNGLPSEKHYSTAYDLAQIARYAMNNDIFSEIVGTTTYTVKWEESGRVRTIKNTNKLLTSYPGANGVKTGTTNKAGQCLVASAVKGNQTLIAVVLKSQNRFAEAAKLLNYGFANYRNITLINKGKTVKYLVGETNKEVELITGKELVITIGGNEKIEISNKLNVFENAFNTSVFAGQHMGEIIYYNNGSEAGRVPLYAKNNIIQVPEERNNIFIKYLQKIKGKSS
ncbi:MAG: D-alanyl-D-alanine carboxypeptidase family protein [Bacillota bacterium]